MMEWKVIKCWQSQRFHHLLLYFRLCGRYYTYWWEFLPTWFSQAMQVKRKQKKLWCCIGISWQSTSCGPHFSLILSGICFRLYGSWFYGFWCYWWYWRFGKSINGLRFWIFRIWSGWPLRLIWILQSGGWIRKFEINIMGFACIIGI